MSANLSDFRQLLDRARGGDNHALEQLVHEYESELTTVVKARLGNALRPYFDSLDLVQSVHKSVLVGLRNDKLEIHSPEHLVRLTTMIVRRKIARSGKRRISTSASDFMLAEPTEKRFPRLVRVANGKQVVLLHSINSTSDSMLVKLTHPE